jgi:hypothetical protein
VTGEEVVVVTLITLLLTAILVALIVQIADARRRERYTRQREQHHREEQGRREQEEDEKPRRRVAVQVFVIGDELRALDGEGRQWTWADDRWWALNHLMLPQVEDDKVFKLFALKHDDKLRDFLPRAKARYEAARADSFPRNINRPRDEVSGAIREFVARLEEPEELREALEREVERNFYIYLKRGENEGQS